jgi:hypothetical protein
MAGLLVAVAQDSSCPFNATSWLFAISLLGLFEGLCWVFAIFPRDRAHPIFDRGGNDDPPWLLKASRYTFFTFVVLVSFYLDELGHVADHAVANTHYRFPIVAGPADGWGWVSAPLLCMVASQP